MEPKHSILLCNQRLNDYIAKISDWLYNGIKVFWFGKYNDIHVLKKDFEPFLSASFLQCFEVKIPNQTIIVDGIDCESIVALLGKDVLQFNAEQYLVEHCKSEGHIIVEASAGTGKTTVMIDRILFLLHTVDNIEPSDISMITFTNAATNQMTNRLQTMFLKKYQLTGNTRYLIWLEKQSQMNISTIDSFAYKILKEYGTKAGFSKELQIQSLNYKRRELIKDEMNDYVTDDKSVRSQLGLSFYKASEIIDKFWEKFAQLGYSKKDILEMDWGLCGDDTSEKFQMITRTILDRLDDEFLDLKRKNNTISINDILRDLGDILLSADASSSDLHMKYLFVDEFQDSDNSQIKILTWIVKKLGTWLFVVGDIKQSIYRFRGADDTAFSTLICYLEEIESNKPHYFSLVNNYRTSKNVLEGMNRYFKSWSSSKLLDYKKDIVPINTEPGLLKIVTSFTGSSFEHQFCDEVTNAIENRNNRLHKNGREVKESDRVVVLCRTNKQLNKIGKICRDNHIPAIVKREGSFYKCEAVRDFYAVISSFVFPDEPKYLFNYLIGPYANLEDSIDVCKLEEKNGDKSLLLQYLQTFLKTTHWSNYYKKLRLQPVMAVLKDMLDSENVVDRYISKQKRRQEDSGWSEEAGFTNILAQAKQYSANLDKLMELLQRNGAKEFTSLYDLYNFLKISIETNREEQEAEVEENEDINCLYCMTVHKAKGMEFDTVIIPYTDRKLYFNLKNELLISNDNTKVGWKCDDDYSGKTLSNLYYEKLRKDEEINITQEETRILYVAMTRAIHSLICFVSSDKKKNTWAHLIRSVGISNE